MLENIKKEKMMRTIDIAPCGINCSLCLAFQREKNKCFGCNSNKSKLKHCTVCSIKNCAGLKDTGKRYCYKCSKYPCRRLRQLDKRYRLKYGTGIIKNNELIKYKGLKAFIASEAVKWKCRECGRILCIHRDVCQKCGAKNPVSL